MSTAFIDSTAAAPGSGAVTSTPDITPPQYDVFNDNLLMVELDGVDACFVDVRKSERCDSDAGYDDDDGLLADHVPARAQTVATGADEVSDRADSTRGNPKPPFLSDQHLKSLTVVYQENLCDLRSGGTPRPRGLR